MPAGTLGRTGRTGPRLRCLNDALSGDLGGGGPEILPRQLGDKRGRAAARGGPVLAGELERVEASPLVLPGAGQRHVQDRAQRELAGGPEVAVAGEVAEAVGDQMAVVELHAPQHVRAARE